MNDNDTEKNIEPKIWHPQQEKILKEWSEIAGSYRWLHNQAHRKFKRQNIAFTLPVIILSTISGTANFSQASFSTETNKYAPIIIGTLNLIAGLITTIAEFLKVSELSENHRSSSISFGKLARNIKVELSLPWSERSSHGRDFLKICRNEMDRLLEQSADIPLEIVKIYEKKIDSVGIYKPEILEVQKVNIYHNQIEEKEKHIGEIVANATDILKHRKYDHTYTDISSIMKPVISNLTNSIKETEEKLSSHKQLGYNNKKNKRRNGDSVSTEEDENINFETTQNEYLTDGEDEKDPTGSWSPPLGSGGARAADEENDPKVSPLVSAVAQQPSAVNTNFETKENEEDNNFSIQIDT